MIPIEHQERPNIKSVYTCANCEKGLFDGDSDHPVSYTHLTLPTKLEV